MVEKSRKQFSCINCGHKVKNLYEKLTPQFIKLTKCVRCHDIADKYIEFETVIILVDSILLSKSAYRHILYNSDFKVHWKLSLVLLLLESFALWRQKLNQPLLLKTNTDFVNEKGFYICCLHNVIDNFILFILLEIITIFMSRKNKSNINLEQALNLYKAITVANFAKFFLLPILIWKDNTTELGSIIHYLLVMGYYLLALIQVYSVVTPTSPLKSVIIILVAFSIKQYFASNIMSYMDRNYL